MGDLIIQGNKSTLFGNLSDEYLRNYIKNAIWNINKKSHKKLGGDSFFADIDSGKYSEEETRNRLIQVYTSLKAVMKTMNNPEHSEKLKEVCEQLKNIENGAGYREETIANGEDANKMKPKETLPEKFSEEQKTSTTYDICSNTEKSSKWLIVMEKNPEVIIDKMNMINQKVVVTNLGRFGYQLPSIGNGRRYLMSNTIGVTKFNSQNEVLTNEVVFIKLNSEDSIKNSIYFVNLLDKYVDLANEYKHGFIGDDEQLVRCLSQANCKPGACIQNGERKYFSNIAECKEELKKLQLEILDSQNIKYKNENRGEEECQK